MLHGSEKFPDLDLDKAGIELAEGLSLEPLAGGFNAQAWRVGEQVIKVTKGSADAQKLLGNMRYEHDILENSIGEYMPPTDYVIAQERNSDKSHVVSTQPFVNGVSIMSFLANPSNPVDELKTFLSRCEDIYRAERVMPDIANVQQGFNVLRNSNVIIDDDTRPILVDTTFGTIQRSKALGPLWNRAIFAGALVAHGRLSVDARPTTSETVHSA